VMRPDFLERFLKELAVPRVTSTQVRAIVEVWCIEALAAHFGESYPDTEAAFDNLSPNLHGLVDSPSGWAALSVLLSSGEAPRPIPLLVPTVH
jgi:hypothetical protein